MTVSGPSAITAPGRTSTRALLVTAALPALIRLGWIGIEGLKIFEVAFAQGRTEATLRWLAACLILAHGTQWLGGVPRCRADPSLFGGHPPAARAGHSLGMQPANPFSRPGSLPTPAPAPATGPAASGPAFTRLPPRLGVGIGLQAAAPTRVSSRALPVLAPPAAVHWSLHG